MTAAGDSPLDAEESAATADVADIRETLAGDGVAYQRLVARHQQAVGDYLWRFTRDQREWEELVQDAFVEAYFSLSSYARRAPFEHWLKRIATRVGYRYWKRQYRRREETLQLVAEELPVADDGVSSAREAAEVVHRLLAELKPRDRLVITLSTLEQRSVAEVVELTGWSKSMVKVQLHRARQRLAKLCEAKGIEP